MPTPPTPPTYWWLTVRIDACRTRDERVAAASGDDAVRMWRELHPNLEVIHVRPMPKLSVTTLLPCPFCGSTNLRYDFCASQGCMVCDDCDAVGPSDPRAADPICDDDAAVAAWNRRAALADKPAADGPAVPEGREPASVVGESSDEELLAINDGAYCPCTDEVNDEDDSSWQYTSDYIRWLDENGTPEEQGAYAANGHPHHGAPAMTASFTYNTAVEVELTMEQLANIIVHLGSDQQARLISLMAEVDFSVPTQLQYVTDDESLTPAGRRLMELIGAYAKPLLTPEPQP